MMVMNGNFSIGIFFLPIVAIGLLYCPYGARKKHFVSATNLLPLWGIDQEV